MSEDRAKWLQGLGTWFWISVAVGGGALWGAIAGSPVGSRLGIVSFPGLPKEGLPVSSGTLAGMAIGLLLGVLLALRLRRSL